MRKYYTEPLPRWCLTDLQPAFYDTESGTALQMVARVYSKIEDLVTNYNSFVDEVNHYVEEFESDVNTKIDLQDEAIAEAVAYMKDNIVATATTLFQQALANGDISSELNVAYDAQTEAITLSISATTGGE